MGNLFTFLVVGSVVVLVFAGRSRRARSRRRNTFYQQLLRDLQAHGLDLVSVEVPPPLFSRPFPKDSALGKEAALRQDSCQYRKVVLEDKTGRRHVAWARLHVDRGKRLKLHWEPGLDQFQNPVRAK